MKIYLLILIAFISSYSFAQTQELKKKEITFKVAGNCEMCKSRIEESLDVKGVKFAEWNQKTQMCNVIYDPRKISEEAIHQTIAKIGHDTEKEKAKDDTYDNLHGCCHYERIKSSDHK